METEHNPAPSGDDRAAHLRKLKSQAAPEASLSDMTASAADPDKSPGFKERRRSPRFQCDGTVELRTVESDVRLWGTVTDISLHGCYAEMSTTFPVNTRVLLNVDCYGIHVSTNAIVRASYPFLGMGMCFTEIDPGQQSQLEQLLRALAGQRAIVNPVPRVSSGRPDHLVTADAQACLDEISDHFQQKSALSREEFQQIAKRARRS